MIRTPYDPKRKPRVGKQVKEWVYELFITSHAQAGLSGTDVLSLYYGRGGFEKVLGDEDQEQPCERWCSWHPPGQEFWQILNQWVWNWRLWIGNANDPQPVRQTLWTEAVETMEVPSDQTVAPPEPLALSQKTRVPHPPESDRDYAPMQVAPSWARSRGKFSGSDFTLVNERTLRCPAGHSMYRRELRQNRLGDLLIMFGINPRTCAHCTLRDQCLADGSKGTGGRRITVVRKRLSTADPEPQLPRLEQLTPGSEAPQAHLVNQPIFWFDWPATRLRRDLKQQLHRQQVIIESVPVVLPSPAQTIPILTREQRAHRRLS
ncbi:hypothetical protein H6F93_15970 [Leptolyngbya sp. FACHB-671]|uniref:hypothetical protein n=1 Tax=Leptolyngbya sp. FACHB-671 TaxID=2692812 RepID=UPI00168A3044|nr:hypothetical protein [Leptolyngbya sp. FACHB-671]MBD2069000.1 hypothetical protein [Leptolyngbya sp. FACHB-671]